jgi:hypothetical protein
MVTPLFLPTETKVGALAFAAGIEVGRIPCLREYRDELLAKACFQNYPLGKRNLLALWRVEDGEAVKVPTEERDSSTSSAAADCRRPNRGAALLRDGDMEATHAA